MYVKWLGKNIMDMEKLSMEKEITIFDFKKIYLPSNKYMTMEEINYFICQNFFKQIKDFFNIEVLCEKCFEKNIVQFNSKDFVYRSGNIDGILTIKNKDISIEISEPIYVETMEKFLDEKIIKNRNIYKKRLSSFYYNELIFFIKNIIKEGETIPVSFNEVEKLILEDIDIKEYEQLLSDFSDLKPYLRIEKDFNCEYCGSLLKVELDSKKIPEPIEEYLRA